MTFPSLLQFDEACPPDKAFFMPPDVSAGMALLQAAAVMKAHGIITGEAFDEFAEQVTEHAVQAAREGRITMITNLGEP